jgi:hypothetical protein
MNQRTWPGLAATLALAACSSSDPTEIVAGVSTQIQVPEYLKEVGVVVQAGGRLQFCESYQVQDRTVSLPASLGVLDRENRAPVTVQVLGFRQAQPRFSDDCVVEQNVDADDSEVMVVRRRRTTFVDDRILFLPLPLKESCSETACGEDETCIGGVCVAAEVDSSVLADYKDELLFGDSNTCFDPRRCLDAARTPVLLEDPASCSFRAQWPASAPMPEPGELNVRVFYDTFGSEVLDLDREGSPVNEQEGFNVPDQSDPLAFRLAPNLCSSNYQQDKLLGVEASALCPPKRPLQPLCTGYENIDLRATADNPDPGPRVCTIAGLRAVESAVYVLMDRSQSMFKFYGDGGLRFAIELPLKNPAARRTRVAFGQLPAAAEQCGTSEYQTPTVPFGDVASVREPIGDILGASSSVLPNDPEMYLEAAMQGAYAALSELGASSDSGFNRKALVVISNRDLASDPCPGPTAIERAAAALAQDDSIVTYAVALDSGDAEALASADAIATAGGTTVFNGVQDEVEGARAVQDILTDLGSCLYEVAPDATTGVQDAGDLSDNATISYLHPLTRVQVDIEHNAQCADGVSASGWNAEGNLVRLCGAACDELRDRLSEVALLHAQNQRIAPAVPLVVTAPCP